VFTHGDLQIGHVFADGDEVTGIIDWSEAGPGDALFGLATLTLGQDVPAAGADQVDDGVGGDARKAARAGYAGRPTPQGPLRSCGVGTVNRQDQAQMTFT